MIYDRERREIYSGQTDFYDYNRELLSIQILVRGDKIIDEIRTEC